MQTCVLKVNIKCQACKLKTTEILGSVCGNGNIQLNYFTFFIILLLLVFEYIVINNNLR